MSKWSGKANSAVGMFSILTRYWKPSSAFSSNLTFLELAIVIAFSGNFMFTISLQVCKETFIAVIIALFLSHLLLLFIYYMLL